MTQRICRFLAFLYCVLFTLSLLGCASQTRVDAPSLLSEVTLQSLHERYPKAFTAKVCVLPGQEPPGTKFIAADETMKTIVSDRDREAFERFLPLASTIFEFDLFARTSSAKLYPASMQLSCPETFDVLRAPEDVEDGESRFMTVVRISTDVHRELRSMVEQTCKTAERQRTDRLYIGQQTRQKNHFIITVPTPPEQARVLRWLGLERIPEPEPSGPRSVTQLLRNTHEGQQVAGLARGTITGVIPGGTIAVDLAREAHLLPEGTRTERITEYCAELGVGIVEVAFGCTGIAAGTGISGTGVGAPVGVPVLAGSVVLTTAGIANCGNSIRHLTIELWRSDDSDGMVATSPPSQPAPAAPAPQTAKPAPTPEPAPAATTPAAKPAQPAKLEPYRGPGGGHHVPAKKAFEGAPGYDANKAPAIPNAELDTLKLEHIKKLTPAQMKLYKAFAKTGQPLTWEAIAQIETDALVEVGMNLNDAKATVAKAIQWLKDMGVAAPVRTPWGGK